MIYDWPEIYKTINTITEELPFFDMEDLYGFLEFKKYMRTSVARQKIGNYLNGKGYKLRRMAYEDSDIIIDGLRVPYGYYYLPCDEPSI